MGETWKSILALNGLVPRLKKRDLSSGELYIRPTLAYNVMATSCPMPFAGASNEYVNDVGICEVEMHVRPHGRLSDNNAEEARERPETEI